MGGGVSLREEVMLETGLGEGEEILMGRWGRGGDPRQWGLQTWALGAEGPRACLERSSKFHLAGT